MHLNTNNLSEVLAYGSGEHCRAALDSLVDAAFELKMPMTSIADLETVIEERAELTEKLEETETELARYKQFFEDVMSAWFETLASGHWPCAEPDDQSMLQAIQADMQQGADAMFHLEQIAARAADGDLMPADALEAWSSVKNT